MFLRRLQKGISKKISLLQLHVMQQALSLLFFFFCSSFQVLFLDRLLKVL